MIFCTYLKAIFIRNLLKSSLILIPWSLIPPNGTRLSCYCCYILTTKMPHNGGAWVVVILYIWILCNNELYWRIFCMSPSKVDDMLFYYSWLFFLWSNYSWLFSYDYFAYLHLACVRVFFVRHKVSYSLANASCWSLYDLGESNFFMAAWSGLESFSLKIGSFHYLLWPHQRCVSDIQW